MHNAVTRTSTAFLKAVIILIGIVALVLLLWEPWLEGVNANAASWKEIYLDDPFLALVYAGSAPFFVALYQAFRMLGYAGKNTIFSKDAVRSLRTIRYCALTIIGFVAAEEVVMILNHGNDDAAGGIAMGVFVAFGSVVVATAAAVFERLLHSAVEMKTEHDLTI